jgi:hypothetical protein
MSRSHRKTPIFGNAKCASSEKADKQMNHKRERAHVRDEIGRATLTAETPDERPVVDRRAHSNPGSMAKDGKRYRPAATPAEMRK